MKNVWILNHYATGQFRGRGGRHYWFARKLAERGYDVSVFGASTLRNPRGRQKFRGTAKTDGVRFTFVPAPKYHNRLQRAINMFIYAAGVLRIGLKQEIPPAVIYASSVHPLTLFAGILLARRYKVPCVCEVRDLWPLSIEVYEPSLRGSWFTKILYRLEHWLYRRADQLVFTMEGGAEYIIDQGWESTVDLGKVRHINNGVDLESFDEQAARRTVSDDLLDHPETFTVVYTGSVRQANKVDVLVDAARELDQREVSGIRILIYGDGDKREEIETAARDVSSVEFRGKVSKEEVPQVLTRADALILHADQGLVAKYGTSMNKLFEYMASGRPIISDCLFGYDLIERYRCGTVIPGGSPEDLADSILAMRSASAEEREAMGARARRGAEDYDFEILADALEVVLAEAVGDPEFVGQGN